MARGMHKPLNLKKRIESFPGENAGKTKMHKPGSQKK